MRAVPAGGVRLVPAQRVGPGARSTGSEPRHPQRREQRQQLGRVAGLSGRDRDNQRPPAAVDQRVRLGGQTAAGPPDAVIVRFVPADTRILVIRRSPPCATGPSRPTSRSGPPGGARSRRADAPRHRGVHADPPVQLTVGVGLALQRGQHPIPGAVQSKPVVPLPHRLPRPELRRQIPPSNSGAVPVDRTLHQQPVIPKRPSSSPQRRQQRLDAGPHLIGQHCAARHVRSIRRRPRSASETRPRRLMKNWPWAACGQMKAQVRAPPSRRPEPSSAVS